MPPSKPIRPSTLGLPPKFSDWRPGQWASIESTINSERRFIGQCAPTGFGKSVYYVACAILSGGRNVITTSTKPLQDQNMRDFSTCGLIDMRGRQNFSCHDVKATCGEGRILGCTDQQSCPYLLDRKEFLESPLGSTNYDYLLTCNIHGEGIGRIDTLILDEAHDAVQKLGNALEIKINHKSNREIYSHLSSPYPSTTDIDDWRTWAKYNLTPARKFLGDSKNDESMRYLLAQIDRFVSNIERLSEASGEWICDASKTDVTVAPVWPTLYSHYLFGAAKQVLLVSATLVPKTMELLGITPQDSVFLTQDHTFDPRRNPVYLYGYSRVDYKMSAGDKDMLIARADQIIDRRLDRKGIIHTISYEFQRLVRSKSRHASIMIFPERASDIPCALEKFKRSDCPCILVSPSISTGYDFPGTESEYQIILKVPFIDMRSPIMQARKEKDPEYGSYLSAQILVQMCGRSMRSSEDQCENFILDKHASWFIHGDQYRHLFPSWFRRQVVYPSGLIQPPRALSLERST